MILGFSKYIKPKGGTRRETNFEKKVLDGTKKSTIRLDPKRRWKAGRTIQFATGVRTKHYNCFKEGICTGTQEIEITHKPLYAKVEIDGILFGDIHYTGTINDMNGCIYNGKLRTLAWNDGFNNIEEFFDWFDKDFKGVIIHWTDLKY